MYRLYKIFIIVFLSFFLSSCNNSKKDDNSKKIIEEKPVVVEGRIELDKLDVEGKSHKLFYFEDKNTFANNHKNTLIFFLSEDNLDAYYPHVNAIKDNFKKLDVVLILPNGIDFFASHKNTNLEVVYTNSFIDYFKTSSPFVLLIDKEGNIVRDYKGKIMQEMLETDIKDLFIRDIK